MRIKRYKPNGTKEAKASVGTDLCTKPEVKEPYRQWELPSIVLHDSYGRFALYRRSVVIITSPPTKRGGCGRVYAEIQEARSLLLPRSKLHPVPVDNLSWSRNMTTGWFKI